ncbi:uracil phosphoribosyltransferase [Synechococcus sp. PCC 6717]|uniref:Uracil phosphoribosyltransferase n=1 Tax=Parathermosynechococcus lividus PCC 6715 TaxID=1917166 RepID=A0A2D2Q492_PARLV|nr:uracil phosphoribosyltransferase [Thermostichus lividus]ATS19295.1 uracil phosphoribosyltransferase [Thermostichus lividus PCC 6715]MCI3279663.1 uracil phosphoribosyltransferase [Synechococcus sp. PCC 6717]
MTLQLRIYVPPHPLIKHWLTVARDANTPNSLFRVAMAELGRWLAYEAVRDWLPTIETTVETPLAATSAVVIDPQVPVAVVPILRAGLALLEGAQGVLPTATIYHLGIVRDECTLMPSCYLNRFPQQFAPQTRVLISEPMLATGGSIMTAMTELTERGVNPALVRIISVVSAPPALQKLSAHFPAVQVYAATIDEMVNEQGFIVPGLGDAGDRAFGTA